MNPALPRNIGIVNYRQEWGNKNKEGRAG